MYNQGAVFVLENTWRSIKFQKSINFEDFLPNLGPLQPAELL